jgi:hypothetical protein
MDEDGWGLDGNNLWQHGDEITRDNYKELGYSQYTDNNTIVTGSIGDGEKGSVFLGESQEDAHYVKEDGSISEEAVSDAEIIDQDESYFQGYFDGPSSGEYGWNDGSAEEFWHTVGEYTPVVGGVMGIVEGSESGSNTQLGIGIVSLGIDAFTFGEGGSVFKGAIGAGGEQILKNEAEIIALNRLNHIFGKSEHALEGLVTKYGSQESAFMAVQNAANTALKAGELTPNLKGILPNGNLGNIINVGGMSVRLIGGRVVNGEVILSSFSRMGL